MGKDAPATEQTMAYHPFEGLFVRELKVKPDSPFGEQLKAAGFDLSAPESVYPNSVWVACVDIAARQVYPALSREGAHRKLGFRFVDGWFRTIAGQVISVIIPLLGPARFVARFPKFLSMGRNGVDIRAVAVSPNHSRLEIRRADNPIPGFLAGILEAGLARMKGCNATVAINMHTPQDYDLDVTW